MDYVWSGFSACTWTYLSVRLLGTSVASYLAFASFSFHAYFALALHLCRDQDLSSTTLRDKSSTKYACGILLLLVLVLAISLLVELFWNARKQYLSSQGDSSFSYDTLNTSTIDYDVESASDHVQISLVEDGVSPFDRPEDNTRRSLGIKTSSAPRSIVLNLPSHNNESTGQIIQPLPRVRLDEGSLDTVRPVQLVDDSFGTQLDCPQGSQEHTGSSAVTAIYVGPWSNKAREELDKVLDDDKEEEASRINTPGEFSGS